MPGRGELDRDIEIKGEETAVVDDHQAVVDRLTREILRMLSKGKVMLVWLFDESLSMKDDQADISNRFDKIYTELDLSGKAQGNALQTAILSYGKELHVQTEPTSDIEKIRAAIDSIPVDESGEEWPCKYVIEVGKRFEKYFSSADRTVALVLVTDESGERAEGDRKEADGFYVEESVSKAQDIRMPIYVIGRQAVFGYPYAHLTYTDPETGDRYHPRITRGPEAAGLECLQTEGLHVRWDAQSSGFGPYELVRLARDSGGIYFMLPTPDLQVRETKFDPLDMKEYVPEYGQRRDYNQARDSSILRRAVHQVINTAGDMRVNLSFSIDPNQMRPQAARAQVQAKKNRDLLEAAAAYLDAEEVKYARDREPSQRWRAHYDLLRGQILAYRVKLFEYEYFLQSFAANPRKPEHEPDPDYVVAWHLRPAPHADTLLFRADSSLTSGLPRRVSTELRETFASNDVELSPQLKASLERTGQWLIDDTGNSVTYVVTLEDEDQLSVFRKRSWAPHKHIEQLVSDAEQLLQEVIDKHPGTPWAARAQSELSRGLSVDFYEWRHSRRYAQRRELVPKF